MKKQLLKPNKEKVVAICKVKANATNITHKNT